MAGRKGDAVLRISSEGGEQVPRDVKAVSAAVKREMDQVNAALAKPGPGVNALNAGVAEMRGQIEALGDRLPYVGNLLSSLGPAGFIAAAGVAGITLGLKAAADAGAQAVAALADVRDSAENLDLSTETFQAVQFAGLSAGVADAQQEAALRQFQTRVAQVRQGTGELVSALKDIDPAFLVAIARADTMEDRLRLLVGRLAETTDQSERVRIATAAFGDNGAAFAAALVDAGGSMDGLIAKAREVGYVIDDAVLARADELNTRIATANALAERQLAQAGAALAGWSVLVKETQADLAENFAWNAALFLPAELQGEETLRFRLVELFDLMTGIDVAIQELERSPTPLGRIFPGYDQQSIDAKREQMADYAVEINRIQELLRQDASSPTGSGVAGEANDAADSVQALLDALSGLARDPALDALRKRGEALTASLRTAEEAMDGAMREAFELFHAGAISVETFDRALVRARETYEAADPIFQHAAAIKEELITAEERYREEVLLTDAAVREGLVTQAQADEHLEKRRAELYDLTEQTNRLREAALAVGDSFARSLGRAVTEVRTLSDAFGLLENLIADVVAAIAQVYITNPLVDAIGGAIGARFGAPGGVGGKTPKLPQKSHGGEAYVSGGMKLPGMGPREVARTLEEGERVLSVPDNAALIAAVRDGGRGGPVVVRQDIKVEVPPGMEVQTDRRPAADPTRELESVILRVVNKGAVDGKLPGVKRAFALTQHPARK